ncbi:MAG: HTH domain-containing protein, partial [Spirochaetaceae bacterium]|nr:HTH domain-containing protein [Spirochaetaceae bacterium]
MRADRLLSLLVLLQSRTSMTAREIAQAFEVSLRTVYRDMDALQRVGVPIIATAGPNGGYSVLPGYRSVLAGFSSDEIGALMAAASAADLHELGMAEMLNTAILKLAAYRRDQGRMVAISPERVLLDGTPWEDSDRSAVLGTVMEAISTQRVIAVEMATIPYGGTRFRLRVQPIGIVH